MSGNGTSSYDDVAGMYHVLWADWYLPSAMPALERLFFSQIPARARVLDLCCGSGHVTKELVARGYTVTGVDNSAELIELARRDLPAIDFRVQDARALSLEGKYRAAVSTFDSLNHILKLEELKSVFRGVHRVLDDDGLFVFDMNLEQAYSADLQEWSVDIQPETVGLVRGKFDKATKQASTELIWFVKNGDGNCWRQQRSTVKQQCYPQTDIVMALREAGFKRIESITAPDAGITAELGFGRTFFSVRP